MSTVYIKTVNTHGLNFVSTVYIRTVNTHSLNFVSTVYIRTVNTHSLNFVSTVYIRTVNTHSLNFVSTVHIRTVHTYSLNIYNVLRTAFATSATISEASGFTLFRRQQPSCAALSGEGVESRTRAGFSHDEMIRVFCALTGGRALLQSNQDAALFTTCQHREQ